MSTSSPLRPTGFPALEIPSYLRLLFRDGLNPQMVIQETQRPIKMRNGLDRRNGCERRSSSVGMRLRVGLWLQYHRETRAGEFEPFSRDFSQKAKLQSGLTPEMRNYEFLKKSDNQPICPSNALACAINQLWANPKLGCNLAGESLAVYAINEIASYLSANHDICRLDRRKTERRAANQTPQESIN